MNDQEQALNQQLTILAEQLDLREEAYLLAVERYTEIGEWLDECDRDENRRLSEIYPQGSFRIGTMIAPLQEGEDFDVDLVYQRDLKKTSVSQEELKQSVGRLLLEYAHSKSEPGAVPAVREKRRCWTLEWEHEPFHMDVLPAIRDDDTPGNSILITDKEVVRWQKSAPIDYAVWFHDQMEGAYDLLRQRYALDRGVDLENVDSWRIKTPLQRTVQILKRHRDIYFEENPEVKPASIIITTLTAHAYANELDLLEALRNTTGKIVGYSLQREGRWYVGNPVRPEENFADRWNDDERLGDAFRDWIWNLRQALVLPLPYTEVQAMFGISRISGQTRQSIVPVPEMTDDSHALLATWPRAGDAAYRASVKSTVHNKQNGRKLYRLAEGLAVQKRKWIRFELLTDVPAPYDVKWQITNTGAEAIQANQLRGDFYEGGSHQGKVRWESTLYAGTHWVQAHVVKAGSLVAQSKRYHVRIRS